MSDKQIVTAWLIEDGNPVGMGYWFTTMDVRNSAIWRAQDLATYLVEVLGVERSKVSIKAVKK